MTEATIAFIRERAGDRCEYCHLPSHQVALRFECEHVIPRQHAGTDALSNRSWSCIHCNRFKGPNLAGIDKQTSRTRLVPLFNPRRHQWDYHFRIEGGRIVGRTRIGRVTVKVLNMNDPLMVMLRRELIEEGLFLTGIRRPA